jgi:hypothetical protein
MSRFLWALLLLFTIFIQSCKEGCKDKSALNYDSKATVENGTCLYCRSSFVQDTATYLFTCSNAPNPNTNAIEFILINTNSNIAGNGCMTEGKQTGSNCKNYLSMVNLTNSNVDGSFSVGFVQNGTEAWFFQELNFIDLGPPGSGLDTINFGIVDSAACSNLTTGVMLPNLNNMQFF